jgi:23S rRNA pseudouridine1911/1915/1917 synthase
VQLDTGTRTFITDRGDAGQRLDLVLRRHLTDVAGATRTRLQSWIVDGQVAINGRPVRRAAARAAAGDRVTVAVPAHRARRVMTAENIPLEVLYEDEALLAIDKPAGMVVHPAYMNPGGTVMNGLLWRARQWPAGMRPSIVGRLDKFTSGVVVAAKTAAMHAALQRALASADAEKTYLAVVYGRVNAARGRIDVALSKHRTTRRTVVAPAGAGAPSVTWFTRLGRVAAPRVGLSLLRCALGTGRAHQIRVHLAARGWPIVGDPTYGEPRWSRIVDPALADALRVFPRQALHAKRVSFVHPVTHERIAIEAPLPQDFEQLLQSANFDFDARGA